MRRAEDISLVSFPAKDLKQRMGPSELLQIKFVDRVFDNSYNETSNSPLSKHIRCEVSPSSRPGRLPDPRLVSDIR